MRHPTLQVGEVLSRYVDLAKLLDLLQSRRLFLPAVSAFQDPLEGSRTEMERRAVDLFSRIEISRIESPRLAALLATRRTETPGQVRRQRRRVFASCWFRGGVESYAMWRLYGTAAGVCLRTTVERIEACMDAAKVRHELAPCYYQDTSPGAANRGGRDDARTVDSSLGRYFRKHAALQWEQEVRLVVHSSQSLPAESYMRLPKISGREGVGCSIPVDPASLIERILLPPGASALLERVVRTSVDLLRCRIPVEPSTIHQTPIF